MTTFTYQDGELYCEGVSANRLAHEYGTPLWLYSQQAVVNRLADFSSAFADLDTSIHYSVKANSNLALLQLASSQGAGFDVVSAGELLRVREAGCDVGDVVFSGVGKTDEELRLALELGVGLISVESDSELECISAIATRMNTVAPILLRLNPDIDPHTHAKTTTGVKGTKFGIDIKRVTNVARLVESRKNVQFRGIHFHLGSPILTTRPYEEAARVAVQVVGNLRSQGHAVDYVNMGGGMGVSDGMVDAPSVDDFARAIVPALRDLKCKLLIEPGRSIVANSCVLVARVIHVKHEGQKCFVIQDAGMNDLIRPTLYDAFHQIWPVSTTVPLSASSGEHNAACVEVDIVGPICESGDFLARERLLPPVKRGDLLSVFSAGAYGSVMSSNYNSRTRGAEVLVAGTSHRIIRRRECFADLIRHEIV